MRVRSVAFIGLVVGAFLSSASSVSFASATAVASSNPAAPSLDRFFSSDGPESLHESMNQGTADEPRAWPEANAWLHASLSDTEKEFLALTATGTVAPNADLNGGLTLQQRQDTTATITVQLRFNQNAAGSLATSLQTDVANNIGATTATVGAPTFTSQLVGSTTYTVATFTLSSTSTAPAGSLYTALTAAFVNGASSLRSSTSFSNIDLSYFPTATYIAGASTTAPAGGTTASPTSAAGATTAAPTTAAGATTAVPTTATATTAGAGTTATPTTSSGAAQPYCATHPTACLNGGTCINGATPTTYSCACGSTYIGAFCQFSLNPASKRSQQVQSGSLPRGKSITRPNVNSFKPNSRHA